MSEDLYTAGIAGELLNIEASMNLNFTNNGRERKEYHIVLNFLRLTNLCLLSEISLLIFNRLENTLIVEKKSNSSKQEDIFSISNYNFFN